MFKWFFLYLLFIHILGDFYFQTKHLARQKNESRLKLIEHGLIYTAVCIISIIPIYQANMLIAALILSLSHIVIDLVKYAYLKDNVLKDKYPPEKERSVYLIDQFLHITCIFAIAFILAAMNKEMIITPFINNVFDIIGIPYIIFISWSLIFLLIWKPANITIKHLLCLNRPSEEDGKKAGGFIGLLERLLILLFLSMNQYSAIGLVLTAKSIARYDEISKDKDFAEYYLLGTLLSTFIVISVYLIVM